MMKYDNPIWAAAIKKNSSTGLDLKMVCIWTEYGTLMELLFQYVQYVLLSYYVIINTDKR